MARRTRMVNKPTEKVKTEVVSHQAHPLAWKEAMTMTHGDWRRLFVDKDGSVVILNNRWR